MLMAVWGQWGPEAKPGLVGEKGTVSIHKNWV